MQQFESWYDHASHIPLAMHHMAPQEQLYGITALILEPGSFVQQLRVTNPEEETFMFLKLADLYNLRADLTGTLSDRNQAADCMHRFRELRVDFFGY
jgi:hypothetical protein